MREMNLNDAKKPTNNRERMKVITTQSSRKIRSDDEIVMLMKSARNRFRKSVADGRIKIIGEREWTLR